jgi:fucose 4-O-acetylase-like acetyltransferase
LKIKQRFKRLLIPYIFWPIIILIIRIIISKINILKQLKYLFYQILIGNGIYMVFWFQFNLIFLSLFCLIIIFLSQTYYLLYLFIIGVLCLLFIYSSIYENLNSKYNKIALFSTIRLPSSYIHLVIGFYICSLKIIDKVNKYKFFSMIFFLIIIYFYIFCDEIYSNSTFIRFVISNFSSICLFLFFIIFPSDKIINNKFINAIKRISYYTGGIYYLHVKIGFILNALKIMEKGTISICLLNYIISYYICLFGHYIFKNTELRYLFI